MRWKAQNRHSEWNFMIGIAAVIAVTLCAIATVSSSTRKVALQSSGTWNKQGGQIWGNHYSPANGMKKEIRANGQELNALSRTGIQLPPARSNNIRVFSGKMLCAAGESSCVHPCDAFYTITEEPIPEDCKCKCVSPNPHDFYSEGSTICTCPGSPISPENDLFPYADGEGPASRNHTAVQEEEETGMATSAPYAGASLSMRGRMSRPVHGGHRYPVLRRGYAPWMSQWPRRDTRYGRIALPAIQTRDADLVMPSEPRFGPLGSWWQPRPRQGLWVGSPPPYLPPDGDYPGGSTGIPMDGYLAFETGYAEEPYHGIYAPMQEAGISS
uniref:Uncharacterized protein n=1 Tax=Hanusia phi TaxID=3032 RepID=A0A7S0DUZ3_9CRYP